MEKMYQRYNVFYNIPKNISSAFTYYKLIIQLMFLIETNKVSSVSYG